MFAVIETGGKQYKVAEGDVVDIEKPTGEYKIGDKITFENVLLIDDGKTTHVGDPYIKGKKVLAILDEEGKADKVTVIRYRAKSRYFKKRGHRQPYVSVKIEKIG